jgi:hypothetical protein
MSIGYRDGILVSEKLAELLRGPNVELLPATLVDHANKVRAENYFVLNPLTIDCLVVDKCYPKWNHINRESMNDCAAYVIDPAKVGSAKLFRIGRVNSHPVIIAKELAKAIAGFSGVWMRYAKR